MAHKKINWWGRGDEGKEERIKDNKAVLSHDLLMV